MKSVEASGKKGRGRVAHFLASFSMFCPGEGSLLRPMILAKLYDIFISELSIYDSESVRGKPVPIQTISDCDIESFSKDSIPLLRVSDNLSITSRDVEYDW